ncbi:hypothetical protein VK792_16785 [Mesobacterium sp. TK19101]|uniref:DUF2975 domain-containing protein n=1 Tax=Mesobacterium hydrothermale TaxID=3111907 RepID=A0ABU6HKG6_9RHOB|nr:hypothetical protein [Mesobacterium sp. TK19101]MEC3862952.1 hypothetical protein [Mesobacterium sp. TK19101]
MIDATRTLAAARKIEVIMTAGIVILIGFACIGAVASVVSPTELAESIAHRAGYVTAPLVLWQSLALIAILGAHLALWLALLFVARRLFRQLRQGNPAAAVQSARWVAYLLWIMLAWGLASQALASVAATWGYPEGSRVLSIAFGTPQISVAFSALIASFMAQAFALGAELWQDHREVI